MNASFRKGSGRRSGLRFDAQNGVVTEALIFLTELDPEAIGDALVDATHYEPTPVQHFEAMMRALPVRAQRFTFVDVGAGMGRIVLLATGTPFKQIIGVEVSGSLCEVARDNVVRWRAWRSVLPCSDVRIVCKDAAEFRMPRGDRIFYMYNPFGEATMRRFIERIALEPRGESYIMYHTPVHRVVLDRHPQFELVHDLGFGVIYRKRS